MKSERILEQENARNPKMLPEITLEELSNAYGDLMLFVSQVDDDYKWEYSSLASECILWSDHCISGHTEFLGRYCGFSDAKDFLNHHGYGSVFNLDDYRSAPHSLRNAYVVLERLLDTFAIGEFGVMFKRRCWDVDSEREIEVFSMRSWREILGECRTRIENGDPDARDYLYLAGCIEEFRDESV